MFYYIGRFIGTQETLWFLWLPNVNKAPIKANEKRSLPNHNETKQHYNNVIMGTIASQITSFTIVYSIVYLDADQRKHQSSASLAFVRGIHRGPVNSPHKWPVTRKKFPVDDVIMKAQIARAILGICRGMSCLTWRLNILSCNHRY